MQQNNLSGEALSLLELGNLYNNMERLDEAVTCYRQSVDIFVRLKDQRNEGRARSNLAIVLLKLRQYDDARREVLRAIECKPYGHVAQAWTTWEILHRLECASGNSKAATQARQQAVESYLAYRRAGGQSVTDSAQLCTLATQAIKQGDVNDVSRQFAELSAADIAPQARALLSKLEAILRGERNAALADDPDLDFEGVVELRLLLDGLMAH